MRTDTAPFLTRRRPRSFVEWRQLRDWGKLPNREANVPGYLLRTVRTEAGYTQAELAAKLGISQQAVARAEKWTSNATVEFMNRWVRPVAGASSSPCSHSENKVRLEVVIRYSSVGVCDGT